MGTTRKAGSARLRRYAGPETLGFTPLPREPWSASDSKSQAATTSGSVPRSPPLRASPSISAHPGTRASAQPCSQMPSRTLSAVGNDVGFAAGSQSLRSDRAREFCNQSSNFDPAPERRTTRYFIDAL